MQLIIFAYLVAKSSSGESTPPGESAPSRTSPPRSTPPRVSPPRTTPPRTSPPRQTTPPRESTPSAPAGAYAAVYVTVYEHKGRLVGLPRTFMRHSSIVSQAEPSKNNFQVYQVIGTPGVGMTYHVVKDWDDPRDVTASLLAMDFVAWIPRHRAQDLEATLEQVTPQVSRSWNCQNWVQEGLRKMVQAGVITNQQMNSAITKQQRAVNLPYGGDTPNRHRTRLTTFPVPLADRGG